jgi:Leucine-rich repeat (LRR) protein
MSRVSPNKIYDDFRQGKLTKSQASDLLMSLVENTIERDAESKIVAFKLLVLIGANEEKVFKFLEHLLVSDLDDLVRGNAANVIINIFSDLAFEPIKWALLHEESETSIILIIKALIKTNNLKLKSLLNTNEYVEYEGKIILPFGTEQIINLSCQNIINLSQIKGLENLINLNKLYLNFNKITEIEGLFNLINLKALHLQGNKIRKIKGLEQLKNLEYLYLNNNEIIKIQGIANLSSLKLLMIYDNRIPEIKKLEHLSNLEILNSRNNRISEIKGLESLNNLKRLDLSNNRITEIKGLENLENLEFLDLSYNQISEIKGLDNLKNLNFLDLRNNKITAIKQLNILKKLKHLYLGFNRISLAENNEELNYKNILDSLNIDGKNISKSPFDFFYTYKSSKNSTN